MRFHKMAYLDGMYQSPDIEDTYYWGDFLYEAVTNKEVPFDEFNYVYAVPADAFQNSPFPMTELFCKDLMLQIVLHDYEVETEKTAVWCATVQKVCGFRLLLRYNCSTDDQEDFWINVGSSDILHNRGADANERVVHAPYFIARNFGHLESLPVDKQAFIALFKHIQYAPLLSSAFNSARKKLFDCKFKIGQRVELLDTNYSVRVRPARVKKIVGRRVFMEIMEIDCPRDCATEDRQYGDTEFAIDEDSFLLFHIGWAEYNNYEYCASDQYKKHAKKIANALKKGTIPAWEPIDATPELIRPDYQNYQKTDWQVGMKFELLDPLEDTVQEFQVATVKKILKDGYMIVLRDDSDDGDSFPIHNTSKFLFNIGYAEKHGIPLGYPQEGENFSWSSYLEKTKLIPTREDMFETRNTPEKADMFTIGARLEATDLCGNVPIYPAIIKKKLGRLIYVEYEGWDDTQDVLVDMESRDIFPLGYCELHGLVLNHPKGKETNGMPKQPEEDNDIEVITEEKEGQEKIEKQYEELAEFREILRKRRRRK